MYRAAAKEFGEGSPRRVLAEGPFHHRAKNSYLNEVTWEHGTAVSEASFPVLPAPPKRARRRRNACPYGCLQVGCVGGADVPEFQEEYAGPVPEHVLHGLPSPPFHLGGVSMGLNPCSLDPKWVQQWLATFLSEAKPRWARPSDGRTWPRLSKGRDSKLKCRSAPFGSAPP